MRRSIFIGVILVLFLGNISACSFFYEQEVVCLGKKIAIGKLDSEEQETIVSNICVDSLKTLRQKCDFVKNLYLASYYSGNAAAGFQAACLQKILEVSKICTAELKTNSKDYTLSILLYYSQISDEKDCLLNSANAVIIEAVINKLSSTVGRNKEAATQLLNNFYNLLRNTKFGDYVPCL